MKIQNLLKNSDWQLVISENTPPPFGHLLFQHQWAAPQHNSSKLGSAFGLHHWSILEEEFSLDSEFWYILSYFHFPWILMIKKWRTLGCGRHCRVKSLSLQGYLDYKFAVSNFITTKLLGLLLLFMSIGLATIRLSALSSYSPVQSKSTMALRLGSQPYNLPPLVS